MRYFWIIFYLMLVIPNSVYCEQRIEIDSIFEKRTLEFYIVTEDSSRRSTEVKPFSVDEIRHTCPLQIIDSLIKNYTIEYIVIWHLIDSIPNGIQICYETSAKKAYALAIILDSLKNKDIEQKNHLNVNSIDGRLSYLNQFPIKEIYRSVYMKPVWVPDAKIKNKKKKNNKKHKM